MSSLTDKGVMVQEFKHFSKMCYEILGEMTCNTGKTYPRIKLLEAFGQSLPRAILHSAVWKLDAGTLVDFTPLDRPMSSHMDVFLAHFLSLVAQG